MFLSAALLFDIQPMYAKMLLPLVGGAPAVWNTVVVFFQLGLVGGYLLAHLERSLIPLKAQTVCHVAVAALALAVLPFRLVASNADGSRTSGTVRTVEPLSRAPDCHFSSSQQRHRSFRAGSRASATHIAMTPTSFTRLAMPEASWA